jgi:hypothetical protein
MTGKRIAVVQSNYLPWKGYFDLIAAVDEFVLFDAFQYTRRSWRNRNRIKTPQGVQWLTVPVLAAPQRTSISEVRIASQDWAEQHLKTLRMAYGRAPYFDEIATMIEEASSARFEHLSDLNHALIRRICAYLGIRTVIRSHRDYEAVNHRQLRLRDICLMAGASVYVSGPTAKCYLDESLMEAAGIGVEWFDYAGYAEYRQLWGPFVHEVSIIDLLFNHGPGSIDYLKANSSRSGHGERDTAAPLMLNRAAA